MTGASERFARHALVPGWQQGMLADATVVVAGVGALGNVLAQELALAGVGRLILCDPDVVSITNLSRAPLFLPKHTGQLKVTAAAEVLNALAPNVQIDARPLPLATAVGLAELRDASLVIGCLDSRAARLQLAGRCGLVRARSIDLATTLWGGEVRLCLDPDGPCFGCSLTAAERSVIDSPWSCLTPVPEQELGASVVVSATVASWGALFAVRVLMGLPVENQTQVIDGERGTAQWVLVPRAADCPLHEAIHVDRAIKLSNAPTVGELLAALGPESIPMLWQPIMARAECTRCGWTEQRWGRPRPGDCPQCSKPLRLRTHSDLANVPVELSLEQAQVAPREILAVKRAGQLTCVELL